MSTGQSESVSLKYFLTKLGFSWLAMKKVLFRQCSAREITTTTHCVIYKNIKAGYNVVQGQRRIWTARSIDNGREMKE